MRTWSGDGRIVAVGLLDGDDLLRLTVAPLVRDLGEPIDDPAIPFEVVGPDRARVRVALQRAAFEKSTMTIEARHAMAAGRGKPGLIESMGVDPEHRRHGYGTAITVAGARVLRQLGASSATVCTASSRGSAVATYRAADFTALPERFDLAREA